MEEKDAKVYKHTHTKGDTHTAARSVKAPAKNVWRKKNHRGKRKY